MPDMPRPATKPTARRPLRGAPSRARQRQLARLIDARRKLARDDRAGARLWINGREVGGADPRYAHLRDIYD